MKLSEFNYTIPKKLIAKYPADPRDSSYMMVLDRKTGEMEDKTFSNILDYFQKGDCLVINDTKVFPARLFGKKEKTNAKIEVLLLRELKAEDRIWDVIVDPARKVRIGNKIYFDENKLYCEIIDNTTSRGRTVRFNNVGDIYRIIDRIGQMPLPDYIKRDPTELDKETYQTVFADKIGSVAVPSAGLHFTKPLIKKLEEKGVNIARITLHIGYSVFDPVDVEDLTKHKMHSEYFEINKEAVETINKALKGKKQVVAAGSSVARALESSVLTTNAIKINKGWTDKFIYPPYEFKIVSRLITNFHPPKSTLMLLSAAFAGKDELMKAYKKAMKQEARFFSYGDSLFVI
ncbi:MAG: tRNA preQ1(34) S-adenosylmethionine ribosyltransferase-isomerase QueA [Ignavibacteria bacterium]|nr:tRNA preQ1(34) S-adenosylmethionine ribosyltransferase-isomerase QueA [Ignavibacteria bacterium]MBL7991619.1 tRNA preQ1(34) S-adenosylmethionine ribosyltransferase-isomerase QueA [Candidatus Kapabacteria bacterium]